MNAVVPVKSRLSLPGKSPDAKGLRHVLHSAACCLNSVITHQRVNTTSQYEIKYNCIQTDFNHFHVRLSLFTFTCFCGSLDPSLNNLIVESLG